MTVSTTGNVVQGTGNGVATTVTFNKKVFTDTELVVKTKVISTGVISTQVKDGAGTYDYTVSVESDFSGATITWNNALPATHEYTVERILPFTQSTSYPTNDPFPSSSHETIMDRQLLLLQQMDSDVGRKIGFDPTVQDIPASLSLTDDATDRASKFIGFDSSGDLTLAASTDTVVSAVDTTSSDTVKDKLVSNELARQWEGAKGADIASAATVDLSTATGRYVEVTGTTTITSFGTVTAGHKFNIRFTGALTLTHNATSLICPGAANINISADDRIEVMSLGSGNWLVTNFQPAGMAGGLVQVVTTWSESVQTGTTVLPVDDTIPQNTEGDQYASLAITPKNANNKLIVRVHVMCAVNIANGLSIALFKDSTANALTAVHQSSGTANYNHPLALVHEMTAGGTSAITFKVRGGPAAAGTFTWNGSNGARFFGAIAKSWITIEERTA